MNSYTFMGLDDVEEGEEISSRKKSFIKRAIAYIKTRRQATQVSRNSITRDRAGAHERLVIANAVTTHSAYFQCNPDYAISPRWFLEEAHQPDDPLRNEEQVQRVMRWIKSSQAHQNLRHDLIEHLPQNALF
ncbi:hypothetical protein Tco_1511381 [Tanacetum coccineum]